jgi:hypothetical protein
VSPIAVSAGRIGQPIGASPSSPPGVTADAAPAL